MTPSHPSAETLRLFPPLPRTEEPSWLDRARAALRTMSQRSETRLRLTRLDERMLRDIGLTSDQIDAEWRKPLWQA